MSSTNTGIGRGARWLGGIAALCSVLAFTAAAEPPPPQPAEMMPLAMRSLVLDITETNARAVAVGERGHVLVSESRSDWRQVDGVPVRSTLTAVTAIGDRVWAVGHDGVILHSADGGLNWAVQRFDPWQPLDPDDMSAEWDPQQGAPLLDVLFLDADNGFAIGAYSLMLRTTDGGASWSRVDILGTANGASDSATADAAATDEAVDPEVAAATEEWTFSADELALMEESEPHLNAIAQTGSGGLLIVAERGTAFRSRNGGNDWERLATPYAGSMFGVVGYPGERVLAFGLRGHILESDDLGGTWRELDAGIDLSLMGGAALDDGGAVLVGGNGVVLHRPDATSAFSVHTFQTPEKETPVLAGVLPLGKFTFVVYGEAGIGRLQLK